MSQEDRAVSRIRHGPRPTAVAARPAPRPAGRAGHARRPARTGHRAASRSPASCCSPPASCLLLLNTAMAQGSLRAARPAGHLRRAGRHPGALRQRASGAGVAAAAWPRGPCALGMVPARQRRLPAPLRRQGRSAWRRRPPGRAALPWSRRRRPRARPHRPPRRPADSGDAGRRRCAAARPTQTAPGGRHAPSRRPRGERVTQSRGRQGAPRRPIGHVSAQQTPPPLRPRPRDPQRNAARAAGATRTRPRPAVDPAGGSPRRAQTPAAGPALRCAGPAPSPRVAASGRRGPPGARGPRRPLRLGVGHPRRRVRVMFVASSSSSASSPPSSLRIQALRRLGDGRAGPRQPAAHEPRARPARPDPRPQRRRPRRELERYDITVDQKAVTQYTRRSARTARTTRRRSASPARRPTSRRCSA